MIKMEKRASVQSESVSPEIRDLQDKIQSLKFSAHVNWLNLKDAKREIDTLQRENQSLREDLLEYHEILCNKQKEIDELKAEKGENRVFKVKVYRVW